MESRQIDPAPGEQPAADWEWLTPDEFDARAAELPGDVVEIGRRAIDTVAERAAVE